MSVGRRRERQRDKRFGVTTRRLSWPTVVLAGGVGLSLAANLVPLRSRPPGTKSWPPSVAFLVAVSTIERRSTRRGRRLSYGSC